jgi:hypothetical protein
MSDRASTRPDERSRRENGDLSAEEWHQAFIEEHEARWREVDEALDELDRVVGADEAEEEQARAASS